MFKDTEQPGTLAARKDTDDVPEEVKSSLLTEVIEKQQQHSRFRMQQQVGKVHKVLVEGPSKRSDEDYCGRNDQNAMVVFHREEGVQPGDYVNVLAERCTNATLKIGRASCRERVCQYV